MEQIKLRVLNRYRGTESDRFGGGAVPEGAVILVDAQRARELISKGLAAPIAGPAETKPAGPVEKKGTSGTGGSAEPRQSSPAARALRAPTARKSPAGSASSAGDASRSRTTSGSSQLPTSSTDATATTGTPSTGTGDDTSTR